MTRTTIVADEHLIRRLKSLARERGVSFSALVREALEEKVSDHRPKPRSVGAFASDDPDLSSKASEGRIPPRSWR